MNFDFNVFSQPLERQSQKDEQEAAQGRGVKRDFQDNVILRRRAAAALQTSAGPSKAATAAATDEVVVSVEKDFENAEALDAKPSQIVDATGPEAPEARLKITHNVHILPVLLIPSS